MTNEEFSREFDIMFQNINSGSAPGVDEYEKSLLLTQASEKVLLNLIASNSLELIANKISTVELVPYSGTITPLSENSEFFELPANFLSIINDFVIKSDGTRLTVIPISHADYKALSFKPYNFPRRRTVWRIVNADSSPIVEIIHRFNDDAATYTPTLSTYPTPIILDGVSETIRGVTGPSNTDLLEALHPNILEVAVQMGVVLYIGAPQQQ